MPYRAKLRPVVYVALPTPNQERVARVLEGYNVCILAYGQTGSGKTHTMFGYGNPNPNQGYGNPNPDPNPNPKPNLKLALTLTLIGYDNPNRTLP